MKRNETLKQQIKTLTDDNNSLQNRFNENKKRLQQRSRDLQNLKAQNQATNFSPEQINALQNKVDSLERNNNILKTQLDSLTNVRDEKKKELWD